MKLMNTENVTTYARPQLSSLKGKIDNSATTAGDIFYRLKGKHVKQLETIFNFNPVPSPL